MPERKTIKRAQKAKRQGKAPTTQAGEFVREQVHHIRQGKHGARSAKQAIAIGLSQARRAGVNLPPPPKGKVSARSRRSAELAYKRGRSSAGQKPSAKRSRAIVAALKREGRSAASHTALARHAHAAAAQRSPGERSAAARKAAKTKGPAKRSEAARKAARTRSATT
jgi:hypothetical protein